MKLEQVKQVREAASVGVRDGNMRFRCSTWDAMGTNMVLKGMHNVLRFPQDDFPDMDTISVSGQANRPIQDLGSPIRRSGHRRVLSRPEFQGTGNRKLLGFKKEKNISSSASLTVVLASSSSLPWIPWVTPPSDSRKNRRPRFQSLSESTQRSYSPLRLRRLASLFRRRRLCRSATSS